MHPQPVLPVPNHAPRLVTGGGARKTFFVPSHPRGAGLRPPLEIGKTHFNSTWGTGREGGEGAHAASHLLVPRAAFPARHHSSRALHRGRAAVTIATAAAEGHGAAGAG